MGLKRKQKEVARAMARGLEIGEIVESCDVSASSIYRWRQDPEFLKFVQSERETGSEIVAKSPVDAAIEVANIAHQAIRISPGISVSAEEILQRQLQARIDAWGKFEHISAMLERHFADSSEEERISPRSTGELLKSYSSILSTCLDLDDRSIGLSRLIDMLKKLSCES
jgi:hypothetical protein